MLASSASSNTLGGFSLELDLAIMEVSPALFKQSDRAPARRAPDLTGLHYDNIFAQARAAVRFG
jgi:hypothetical protein